MAVGTVALILGVTVQPATANASQNNGCLGVTGTFSQFAIPITGTASPNPDTLPATITLSGTSVSIGVDSTLIGAGVVAGLVSAADNLADIGATANDGTPLTNAGVDAVTAAAGKVTLKITGSNTAEGVKTASNSAPVNTTFYVTADSLGGSVNVYKALSSPPSATPDPSRTGTLLTGALTVPIPLADTTWTPTGGNVVFAEQNLAPASLTAPNATDQIAAPLILLPKINGAISVPFHCWPGTVSTASTPNPLVPAVSNAIDTVTVNAATTSSTGASSSSSTSSSSSSSTSSSSTSSSTTSTTLPPPPPAITAAPHTGLVDGQSINVSGSGFDQGGIGGLIECNSDPAQPTVSIFGNDVPVSCTSLFPLVNFDSGGLLPTMPFIVHSGTVGPPQPGTDSLGNDAAADAAKYPCPPTADQIAAGQKCVLALADLSGHRATQDLSFLSQETTTTTAAPSTTTTTAAPTTTTTTKASTTTVTVPKAPAVSTNLPNVAPGGTLTLSGDGFPPNTPFTVTLHSTPVDLGTGTTDSNGHFAVAVTIPPNIDPGQHTITVATADGQHTASVDLTVNTATTVAANTATTSAAVGAVAATPAPSSLAFTGLDGRAWLTIAAGCLLSGLVMLYGKPRTATSRAPRR